jgi:hypothetical protein
MRTEVDKVLVEKHIPRLHSIIDRLLACANPPKELMVEARGVLPARFKHSFIKSRASES